MSGDVVHVEYILRNRPESAEDLFVFSVDAPSPVLLIPRPEPREGWLTSGQYRGSDMASWTMLGTHLAPGAESPPLHFEAIGLPAIVTFWVRGYFPPPPLTDADVGVIPPSDLLRDNSVPGATVGVEPFPDDLSPANLLRRLDELTARGFEPALTPDDENCEGLREYLEEAREALNEGETDEAAEALEDFLDHLEELRGEEDDDDDDEAAINDSAYWLLKVNAEFLLSTLG